jgi:flavin-binding protein dodecin
MVVTELVQLGLYDNHHERGGIMSAHTYRVTEIVGTSEVGLDDAIRNGLGRASQTLRHLDWFEVTQIRGHVDEGDIQHFQVGLKVGFRMEDD